MRDTFILTTIKRCMQMYHTLLGKTAKKYGLSQTECDILIFLHFNPQLNTAKDISTIRLIAKSNVSTGVEALRKKGYITASADPKSRRVIRLEITQNAQKVIQALVTQQNRCLSYLKEGFNEAELEQIKYFVDRLDANVQNGLAELDKRGEE